MLQYNHSILVNKMQEEILKCLKGIEFMRNQDIRNEVTNAGLKLWQIAEKLGINDGNFSRMLRKELSDEKKAEIRAIIEELKGGEE